MQQKLEVLGGKYVVLIDVSDTETLLLSRRGRVMTRCLLRNAIFHFRSLSKLNKYYRENLVLKMNFMNTTEYRPQS